MSSISISSYGVVPVGGIMPISSNLTGSHTIPATGVVDGSGWMYCDGSAIPGGNTLSGSVPDLTGERFIVGSTSAGSTGGANSISIAHTHTMGTHTHTMGTHTHNMKHNHQVAYETSDDLHFSSTSTNATTSFTTAGGYLGSVNDVTTGGAGERTRNFLSAGSYYSTGAINNNSGSGSSALTGATDPGDTNATDPGDTNSGGTVTHNNRPLYISMQYLIRVK